MPAIRVLIVDDSLVIRRLLSDLIASEPDMLLVAAVSGGRAAIERLDTLNPDVMILDVEMPDMNGIETLAEVRKTHSRARLPVIMCSTLTKQGDRTTMEVLFKGANDYIHKPSTTNGAGEATQILRQDLLPKIRHLGGKRQAERQRAPN